MELIGIRSFIGVSMFHQIRRFGSREMRMAKQDPYLDFMPNQEDSRYSALRIENPLPSTITSQQQDILATL